MHYRIHGGIVLSLYSIFPLFVFPSCLNILASCLQLWICFSLFPSVSMREAVLLVYGLPFWVYVFLCFDLNSSLFTTFGS